MGNATDSTDQSRRWEAAIGGLIEIPSHAVPPHEQIKPVYSLGTSSRCWRIKFPDGSVGWASAGRLDPDHPTYYLQPEMGNECLLQEATKYGRGTAWAEIERHQDCGRARREMCRAIISASTDRRKRLNEEILAGQFTHR
jgi:hypothetical protein